MWIRLGVPALRVSLWVTLSVAMACGGNTIDFVSGSALDANQAGDANQSQAANTTLEPASAPDANVPVTHSPNNANNANAVMKCPTPTTPVTYTNAAKALINEYCLSCHTSRGPAMGTYASAKSAFDGGGGSFDIQNGVMPPSEKLSFAIKCNFQAWADNNYAQ